MIGQVSGNLILKAHAKSAVLHRSRDLEYCKSNLPVILCGTTEYIRSAKADFAAAAGLKDRTNCAKRLAAEDEGEVG